MRIVVLVGGLSNEREVSLDSGKAVARCLQELGHDVIELDVDADLAARLMVIKPDVAFNALHGTYGEDGAVAGLLECLMIPYTHSGILASAMAMNKPMTKLIAKQQGIRTADGQVLTVEDLKSALRNGHLRPLPYVIKPTQDGSAIGVYIIRDEETDLSFLDEWHFGNEVLVEEYIPGKEISVAVLQGEALGAIEIEPLRHFYDYEAKYVSGAAVHVMPARLPSAIYEQACHYASVMHNVLGCRTVSRTDLRYDPARGNEGLYFLELNTHPGFTELSLVPEIAQYRGISFADIVQILVNEARCDLPSRLAVR